MVDLYQVFFTLHCMKMLPCNESCQSMRMRRNRVTGGLLGRSSNGNQKEI
jgi:hypothetical protein